jgi:hypothetical protein
MHNFNIIPDGRPAKLINTLQLSNLSKNLNFLESLIFFQSMRLLSKLDQHMYRSIFFGALFKLLNFLSILMLELSNIMYRKKLIWFDKLSFRSICKSSLITFVSNIIISVTPEHSNWADSNFADRDPSRAIRSKICP